MITAVCAVIDLILFLASVSQCLSCFTDFIDEELDTAVWTSPHLQPTLVKAVHQLSHVELELSRGMEVWDSCWEGSERRFKPEG